MTRRQILEFLKKYAPRLADQFEASISEITNAVDVRALENAIEARNVDLALEILDLDPRAFSQLAEGLRQAFHEAGRLESSSHVAPISPDTGARLNIRFDIGNPRAESAAANHSSNLIQQITDETRLLARVKLTDGIAEGLNPRSTALDIVGRINRVTGNREGGIIGLTEAQEGYVNKAREQLDNLDKGYFQRARRDKRYDMQVMKAIKEGKDLTESQKDKILGRYRARLLKLRGEMIGRTESTFSLNAGRYEAISQMIDSGITSSDLVKLIWRDSRDARVREEHILMNGQVREFGRPFTTPDGFRLRFPGDSTLGAQGDDVIACRCYMQTKIDWIEGLGRVE